MLRQGALTIVGASLFNLVKGESKLDLLRRLARLAAVSDAVRPFPVIWGCH